MYKKVFQKKKIGFQHFNAPRSSVKVSTSAMLKEVSRESMQKRVWVSEWVMMSSQKLPNTASSVHGHFSSG